MNPETRTSERSSAFRPGFELHPITARAAAATPGRWRDAVVVSAHAEGTIEVADMFDGRITRLWNYLDHSALLATGEPVALHDQYGVLAAGDLRVSVRVAV